MILVECRGSDAAQIATSQCRLEYIGRIHGAATFSCTHKGVDFIDKQDDFALGLGNLVDDRFEAFLKLALIFGASNQCAHVERIDLFALQILGNIAAYNALCQSLNNSCFSGSRLTDKDGIVLGTTTQDLQYASDFVVTADNGIEFTLASAFVKVDGIFA